MGEVVEPQMMAQKYVQWAWGEVAGRSEQRGVGVVEHPQWGEEQEGEVGWAQ